jgi:DNA-binding NarL/FixJ family response regulator
MSNNLTPRETEIQTALLNGETCKEIAARLWISRETVKTHVRRLLEKQHYHSIWEMRFGEALRERDAEIERLRALIAQN